jgi:hypothetical protein
MGKQDAKGRSLLLANERYSDCGHAVRSRAQICAPPAVGFAMPLGERHPPEWATALAKIGFTS